MRRGYTVERVREAEQALMARLPAGALMQRAAAGLEVACAERLRALHGRLYGARLVVLAGSGDNGGDALWAAARLARRGVAVEAIVLDPDRVHAEGLAALRTAGGRVADGERRERAVANADLALDGIVGIGGKPGLRSEAASVLDLVERRGRPVVAVDVPSGIDVDTGETPARCVRAESTVTFGAYKPGLLVDPGARAAGDVRLVDIGLGPELDRLGGPDVEQLEAADAAARLPVPDREAQKYSRGVLGVLAGSEQYGGAAVLATGGALAGSIGMVRYVGPDTPSGLVLQAWPEVVIGRGRVQAWLIGSGLGPDPERHREVDEALGEGARVLVDADGLRHLPERFAVPALLTPHEGELARMLDIERGKVSASRLRCAREAAARWDATVLLKGPTTVVAAPDGRTRVAASGTPWLATGGSGDVLSGVCGSLLASGLDPLDAGSVGAYLHQRAGARASSGGPITPQDVIRELPGVIRDLLA